jgi:hypothetical protein
LRGPWREGTYSDGLVPEGREERIEMKNKKERGEVRKTGS